MEMKITQSNKKDYIGKDFLFHLRKDLLIIGWKIMGMGKKYEIPCDEVKEFKILDENSKPVKKTSALKKTGGAVVGGILTGGIGSIIGAMITGNSTKNDLKINLGFKLKNKDWFIATMEIDDKKSFVGGLYKSVIENIVKRFSVKSKAPF